MARIVMNERHYMIDKVTAKRGALWLEVTENREGACDNISLSFRCPEDINLFREALAVCQGYREATDEEDES